MLSTRQGLLNPVVSTKSTFANGKLITTNGSLPAANSMVDVLGPPQPDIANGVVYIQCQAGSSAIISFRGDDDENEGIVARISGVVMAENTNAGTDQPNQYMIEPICDVTATLGSKVGPSGGMYDNTLRIADEINVDRDYVQNSIVRKLQPATPQNDTAKLLIDTLDYQFIRIDLRTANADKGAVALVRWIRSG